MTELTDKQKDLLAHALFCYTAGIGQELKRSDILDLVHDLGVMKEYSGYAYEVVKTFEDHFGMQKKKDE
jgi:hypothetical protein